MSRKILFLFVLLAITGQYGYSQWNDNSDWKSHIVRNDQLLMDEPNYPWDKKYFKNQWGETNYNAPYISTDLNGTGGWNIIMDYLPSRTAGYYLPNGSFTFYITNRDDRMEDIEGPVYILVRPSNGETYTVKITGVKNSVAFVEDQLEVKGLMSILNAGYLDIMMEFDLWGERHYCKTYYCSYLNRLNDAIKNYLTPKKNR